MQTRNGKALRRAAWLMIGSWALGAAAWAQGPEGAPLRSRLTLWEGLLSTLLFGLVGILLAVIGFKVFDRAIHHDIEREIFEHKNMAAALLAGAVVLGVSLIVAATLLS